jgi:hypothetical protein
MHYDSVSLRMRLCRFRLMACRFRLSRDRRQPQESNGRYSKQNSKQTIPKLRHNILLASRPVIPRQRRSYNGCYHGFHRGTLTALCLGIAAVSYSTNDTLTMVAYAM